MTATHARQAAAAALVAALTVGTLVACDTLECGDGTHRVSADQKVGITVYGVMSAGSYWFPGGLDLDVLPQ